MDSLYVVSTPNSVLGPKRARKATGDRLAYLSERSVDIVEDVIENKGDKETPCPLCRRGLPMWSPAERIRTALHVLGINGYGVQNKLEINHKMDDSNAWMPYATKEEVAVIMGIIEAATNRMNGNGNCIDGESKLLTS